RRQRQEVSTHGARDRLPQDGPRRPISGLSPAIHAAGCPRVVPENGDGLVASSLVASVVGLSHCLKYKEKTRSWAAGTLLERTSKTCRDHAYSIVLATTVCPVFLSPHRLCLLRLTYAMATVRSFSMPENFQVSSITDLLPSVRAHRAIRGS